MKAPRKIVCLESYWNEELFQHFSVKGFLDGMAPLVQPPLTVAHRFVDSAAGLAYYLRRPGGWMASLVCDLLFLRRFYSDPAPWNNLRRIFNSVHRDYPAARHLLITRRDVR